MNVFIRDSMMMAMAMRGGPRGASLMLSAG
jgi:hypothetical protein